MKRRHFGFSTVVIEWNWNRAVLRDQAEGYVRAIQWILHYYYDGVCSWSWFYPHHYAPYVSDIRDFASLDLHFELGQPFLPYEQLLGVLPAASRALLPEAYRSLMCSANSPIIEFYPSQFQVTVLPFALRLERSSELTVVLFFYTARRTRTASSRSGRRWC